MQSDVPVPISNEKLHVLDLVLASQVPGTPVLAAGSKVSALPAPGQLGNLQVSLLPNYDLQLITMYAVLSAAGWIWPLKAM